MTDRWDQVRELLADALKLPPEQRDSFIREACNGDSELQIELESLLGEQDSSFLDINNATAAAPFHEEIAIRLAPGTTLSGRFQIVRFINRGGMGEVYEAKDLQLNDRIALKTNLASVARDTRFKGRFRREIQLAKRVTHVNVCRIYDLGIDTSYPVPIVFLTMELLDGETLSTYLRSREPMSSAEALPLVEEMAAGLTAAHRAGVIHRDFKPANVILLETAHSSTRRLVITDFGLAQTLSIEEGPAHSTLTRTGEFIGTPDYMAPEQVTSSPTGPETDIYALGVVIYEMVTGKRPFGGDSALAKATRRLREPPVPPSQYAPDLPRNWEAVILRCLEVEPSKRFHDAEGVVEALRKSLPSSRRSWLIAGAGLAAASAAGYAVVGRNTARPTDADSIAVLPLESVGLDGNYLGDQFTDDIIGNLGQVRSLRVMPRSSVFRFRDAKEEPSQIGRKLGVQVVLSGRLEARGESLSISVELVDAQSNRRLWNKRYERRRSDITSLVREVSGDVARHIRPSMPEPDRASVAALPAATPEAYELYALGRHFWNRRTQEGFREATGYFKKAIQVDPRFAAPYAGLADCYAMQSGVIPPREVFPEAEMAARAALQLDPNSVEAHAARAFIQLYYHWDWQQTEDSYKRAISLNPNYPSAHSMYAIYLAVRERFAEALEQSRIAYGLDPALPTVATGLGRIHMWAGDYPKAIAQFERVLHVHPQFSQAHISLATAYAQQGRYSDALTSIDTAHRFTGTPDAGALADTAYIYAISGRTDRARQALQEILRLRPRRYVSAYFPAVAYAALGQTNDALAMLERGLDERTFLMVYLKIDARLNQLRGDSRFNSLLAKVNLT
ncbi:MAG TPA: protein kinase [Bryobacteraceae bacterium]|nr:protein kinase [Bryobacteraceae bacterium]